MMLRSKFGFAVVTVLLVLGVFTDYATGKKQKPPPNLQRKKILTLTEVLKGKSNLTFPNCYVCPASGDPKACQNTTAQCLPNEVCSAQYDLVNGNVVTTKGCSNILTCLNRENNNPDECSVGRLGSRCNYCCRDDLCNVNSGTVLSEPCGKWSDWSTCSATCGHGTQTRTRKCSVKSTSNGRGKPSKVKSHLGSKELPGLMKEERDLINVLNRGMKASTERKLRELRRKILKGYGNLWVLKSGTVKRQRTHEKRSKRSKSKHGSHSHHKHGSHSHHKHNSHSHRKHGSGSKETTTLGVVGIPLIDTTQTDSRVCLNLAPCPTIPKTTRKPTTPEPTTLKPTTTTEPTTLKPTTTEPTTLKPTTPEPTTLKPTTPEPTTLKSTTPEPTTLKPTTPEPITLKPTTPEPITFKPTTPEPTTLKPRTLEPTTLKPTTPEPTTLKPTTLEPTTLKPTTFEPTTLKPTTPEPTTLKPTTLEPTTLKPTTLEPTTLKPTTPEPTTLKPTTLEPTTLKPTTPEPTTLKPTTPEPITFKPTTPEPTTLKPTTPEPTTLKPTTLEPTTLKPTTLEPTTLKPTTPEPTTLKPTTLEPTTLKPTTPEPTTLKPTTPEPITFKPTTPEPTTLKPTTPEPTTLKPTTTSEPTTLRPTTTEPTTLKPTTIQPTEPAGFSCYTCDPKDDGSCDEKLEACSADKNYCLNTLFSVPGGKQAIRKRCVSKSECQLSYFIHSCEQMSCINILYGISNTVTTDHCGFCCAKSKCNKPLVPKGEDLYPFMC